MRCYMLKVLNFLCLILIIFCFLLPSKIAANTIELNQKEYCDSLIDVARLNIKLLNYKVAIKDLTEASYVAEKKQLYWLQFTSLTSLAQAYSEMYNNKEAIDLLLRAYELAKKKLDSTSTARVLNNMAILYSKEKRYDKAEETFKRAADLLVTASDSMISAVSANNLANLYNKMNNPVQALLYARKASVVFEKTLNREYILLNRQIEAESLRLLGKNIDSENIARETLASMIPSDSQQTRSDLLMILSQIYFSKGELDKSLHLANSALQFCQYEYKKDIFDWISKIHLKRSAYSQAIVYKDSASFVQDSLIHLKDCFFYENSVINMELLDLKNRIFENELEMRYQRIGIWTSMVLIIILIFFTRILLLRSSERRTLVEQKKKLVELQLEDEKNKKIILENQLESRNRELIAKALHLSGRNEIILETLEFLNNLADAENNVSIRQYVLKLRSQLKDVKDSDDFLRYFKEVNSKFMYSLKASHPNLSANDVRYIIYVYMGLNTKEIASLLNITLDASKKRKQRIAAKLGLEDVSGLYAYLTGL